MAFLQELASAEIREVIDLMAEQNLVVALTVRYQGRWVTFRTRVIAQCRGVVWVEKPKTDHLPTPYEFDAGGQVGVSFSMAHRKYVFSARTLGHEVYRLDEQNESTALTLGVPKAMHKVERRLHDRLDLSIDQVTRASFWLGGWEARPEQASVAAPVWSGRILNVSTGGLLVRTGYEAAKYVEVGDILGVHITFGGSGQSVFVDAQLRHCARDGEMALVGLQFVEDPVRPESNVGVETIHKMIADQKAEKDRQKV
jgi:hypothetical protein